MKRFFNLLAVVGAAAFGGAMLTIGVTLGGIWKSLPAEAVLEWFFDNGQFVMRTIPLVVVPTLIGLAGSLVGGWSDKRARLLWGGATLCIAAVLLVTIIYFVPTNTAFASEAVPLADVGDRVDSWLAVHNLRIGLAFLASILGAWALAGSERSEIG